LNAAVNVRRLACAGISGLGFVLSFSDMTTTELQFTLAA
jgi:hypothetical protein